MVEIINLKGKRKDKARQDRETAAAANRAKFGRTKDEMKLAEARQELAVRQLNAHKLDNERE